MRLYLSKQIPSSIHIEKPSSFFHFLYHQDHLKLLFESDTPLNTDIYSLHLWENISWDPYLSKLNKEYITKNNTTYNKIVRQFI